MGQLLQFQNLHRTKKSEGSTPELFDPQVEEEEEEEEEGEESASDPSNLDNGPFGEAGAGRGGLEDQYPVLELQPVPIPSKQTTFSFGE